jgi:plasmid stabilization system protein ParE
MVKRIIFSPKAIEDTKQIILYLKKEWSENSAKKFINTLREKISI